MKTARQRAEFWLVMNVAGYSEKQVDCLEVLLKEQDKITRHACADAVRTYAIKDGYDKQGVLIETARAEAECINVKAV